MEGAELTGRMAARGYGGAVRGFVRRSVGGDKAGFVRNPFMALGKIGLWEKGPDVCAEGLEVRATAEGLGSLALLQTEVKRGIDGRFKEI